MMTPAAKTGSIAFSVTTLVALLVYSSTLAPQVTFGYSGIFSAAAMYPGPSTPSGHPLWAICGWIWIKVFPFGNIAWRFAFASAIAAAISCGIVAVIVARTTNEPSSGTVGGILAGLGLAFEQGFWSKAVVVDSWPLTALIFTSTLYCLSRWFFNPTHRRSLYIAAFLAGAGLAESQALAPAMLTFPVLVAFGSKLGRDLFRTKTLTMFAWVAGFFVAGLQLCFLLPVLSMTNPPVNWGYPRTEEGFAHVLTRGQFDSFTPPPTLSELTVRLSEHLSDLTFDIGPMYFIAALLTITLWTRAPKILRKWIVGLWLMWIITTTLSVAALNLDHRDLANTRSLFTPAIAVLMILAGCGVNLACRPRARTGQIATRVHF